MKKLHFPSMARPFPPPENRKIRTTISLPEKTVLLAKKYLDLHPEEGLADFSAIVSRALIAFAEKRHPDLLADCIREIRAAKSPAVKMPIPASISLGRSTHVPQLEAVPVGQTKTRRKIA